MMQLPPYLLFTLSGVLGAVANVALGSKTIVLPRMERHRLRLGFLAQLGLCIGVAHAVDHDFQSAFFASLCGTALLRQVKRHIEETFGEVAKKIDDDAE